MKDPNFFSGPQEERQNLSGDISSHYPAQVAFKTLHILYLTLQPYGFRIVNPYKLCFMSWSMTIYDFQIDTHHHNDRRYYTVGHPGWADQIMSNDTTEYICCKSRWGTTAHFQTVKVYRQGNSLSCSNQMGFSENYDFFGWYERFPKGFLLVSD